MKIAIVTGASSGMGKEFVRQIERFYKELGDRPQRKEAGRD